MMPCLHVTWIYSKLGILDMHPVACGIFISVCKLFMFASIRSLKVCHDDGGDAASQGYCHYALQYKSAPNASGRTVGAMSVWMGSGVDFPTNSHYGGISYHLYLPVNSSVLKGEIGTVEC